MLATAAPAPALPALKVDSGWVASARTTRVAALSLSGLPSAARVVLRCRGGGCPFRAKTVATHGEARVSLTRSFRHVVLRPGAQLDVRVSDSTGTLLVRFRVRRGKAPVKERSWQGAPRPIVLVPGAPAPGSPPGGPPVGQPGSSKGQQALDVATAYVGTPFVWGGAGDVSVLLDGHPIAGDRAGADVHHGVVRVDRQRLYHLVSAPASEHHALTLRAAPGIQAYAFTFG